jgi:DNA polymerase III subunit gamma/tau
MGLDCTFDAVAEDARPAPGRTGPVPAETVPAETAPADTAPTDASSPVPPASALPPEQDAAPSPVTDVSDASDGAARGRREPPASSARRAQPRRTAPEPPTDDIPLPPEPPPDDVPPEESAYERSRRRAGARPSPAEGVAPVTAPAAPAPSPPRVVRLADDIPSADDVDLDGSGLVGASVVEQLLGGRVIEERQD